MIRPGNFVFTGMKRKENKKKIKSIYYIYIIFAFENPPNDILYKNIIYITNNIALEYLCDGYIGFS